LAGQDVGRCSRGDDGLRHCWAHAGKGLPTVLKDTALENAEKGKSYSVQLADKAIKRGSMTQEAKAACSP